MALGNTRAAYGWAAIALHWISAVGVIVLYLLGEQLEEAVGRPAKVAAMASHVSVGMLFFTFLAARLLWSLSQPRPEPLEQRRVLRIAAEVIQGLFLLMIAVQLLTGPLVSLDNDHEPGEGVGAQFGGGFSLRRRSFPLLVEGIGRVMSGADGVSLRLGVNLGAVW